MAKSSLDIWPDLIFASLPDDLFYRILSYVEKPCQISVVLCQKISPLCHAARFVQNDSLWEIVLGGYGGGFVPSSPFSSSSAYSGRRQRRTSKRLRRTTAKEDVIHAHKLLCERTELTLMEVGDMAILKKPHSLSLARLRQIIKYYGPHLNINQLSSTGSVKCYFKIYPSKHMAFNREYFFCRSLLLFYNLRILATIFSTLLVDLTRARHITERVILSCIKELVEKHGASPNIYAVEGSCHVRNRRGSYLPALVVAAARGMPEVVKYLLNIGASLTQEGTSRFRLHTNSAKSVAGTYSPLNFSLTIKKAELACGATNLKCLNRCIELLEERGKLELEQKS